MNNNFNNQNNQGAQNGTFNNNNGQFNGNIPPQQPMMDQSMAQPMMQQQPTNNFANQQMVNPNPTNVNPKTSSKSPAIIIIVVLLVIAVGGLVLVLASNNDDTNDSKLKDQTNNNTEVNNSTNNESDNQTNSNTENTNDTDDDSADIIPLNTFANIGEQVEMKVNHTYVADKFHFATRITLKNNGSNEVILRAADYSTSAFAYFQAHFIPKNIGLENATENDLILEPCHLSKIVRSDGVETDLTSGGKEHTVLKAGETLDGIVYCSITRVEGEASGVEPVLFHTEHMIDSNKKVTTSFDTRNSLK